MRRPATVVWAVTLLAGLSLVCVTVLIAIGKVDGGNFAVLIGSFLAPVVMILLSVQQQQTQAELREVHDKVNGNMSALIAKVPDQTDQAGGI
jgi:hypothetical protein